MEPIYQNIALFKFSTICKHKKRISRLLKMVYSLQSILYLYSAKAYAQKKITTNVHISNNKDVWLSYIFFLR